MLIAAMKKATTPKPTEKPRLDPQAAAAAIICSDPAKYPSSGLMAIAARLEMVRKEREKEKRESKEK